ncbi:Gfo/Idh/MocA family oxidoreductase [Candidatus Magnetominusculus xianensis]|uniref:Oxidoreductase n=1 Tax=Candidatus Magnetominusculus xianensis TaxID=1748249 RepID=A0ABR5SHI2_9BACT|nr:Gfo/Idh/MocA family oxidoreductase [Candidatus Magnetominusculus xianensis]KWT91567.1 oxidoreductase [Candidatus Magnetominusculus xianensis]MBF0404353.1 Gfo/Idh/MocA family oxidoreductase [Nitrospirota bacterium]
MKFNERNILHIGLVGLGYWGKNTLRNLHELGVIHTACDIDPNLVSELKGNMPDIRFTTSFEDVLRNKDIKAVAISTPAVSHYELVRSCLLANKDVFVEKPLSLRSVEAVELTEIAARKNKILMVGHILHYHPAIIKLKELISMGTIGKIRYIYSNRLNIGKLRMEENILWSFAPHDISVILMIVGEEPLKVSATGGAYLNKGIYDTTLTTLQFSNDVKGHVFVSWLHPYKEQKLIVVGSKSMIVFDDVAKDKLQLYNHKINWKDGKVPVAEKSEYQTVDFDSKEPLKEELRHFIECINLGSRPRTDGYEAIRVLKVLESAEASLASNVVNHRSADTSYFVHESAYIDEGVEVGSGTAIWHFSHILRSSKIGSKCVIGQNVMIGPDVEIGNGCKVQNNVSIYKGVLLEDDVFCGPSCVFTNVYNPRAFMERKHEFRQTIVKRGATIGANSTIVCGVTIGRYAMIGAGAVVKSDVPDFAVVAGVPAKQINWICKCGVILKYSYSCNLCNSEYLLEDKGLRQI